MQPAPGQFEVDGTAAHFRATLRWLDDAPPETCRPYLLEQGGDRVCAAVVRLASTPHRNETCAADFETHRPVACGPFSLLEPGSAQVLGSGEVVEATAAPAREARGVTVWFTGLSGAGKTTLSNAIAARLAETGRTARALDGDEVRRTICKGLGFSKADRDENIRRIGFAADLLSRGGGIVLVSAISPYRAIREEARARCGNFIEVYVNAPVETCEGRDVKGLYRKARAGEVRGVTGIDDPYEPPLHPEIECRTDRETVDESVAKVLRAIEAHL